MYIGSPPPSTGTAKGLSRLASYSKSPTTEPVANSHE